MYQVSGELTVILLTKLMYRSADKSLAGQGRKQANVYVRMA